jgi:S-formylglutathione hydrolase
LSFETVSQARCFGGTQFVYRHVSHETNTPMRLAVFVPPQAKTSKVPVVWFLSGLTCTEENFTVKGAGFYVDATEAPWAEHYRMRSYIERELPALVADNLPADMGRQGITGHSMGGHGALTVSLRNPGRFAATSAFAPIASPMNCPWGEKALSGYIGPDRSAWLEYDACALIEGGARLPDLLVDQGTADSFLENQLKPGLLEEACTKAGQPLTLRRQEGYDHSYFFIASFIEDHLRWHAQRLGL